jgi:ferric iron reductase protein FhuF
MRLNFEFTKEQVDQLNKLKLKTGVSSMKELFNNAFAMLDWAVDEVQGGREIAALSVEQDSYRIFVTPLLRQAKVNVMGDTVPPPGVVAQLFTEQPR